MRILFCLFAIIFTSGCVENSLDTDYIPSPKSRLVDEIGNNVFKQLKEQKNLYPCECGGRMMDEITLLHIGLTYYEEIDIEKARDLLVTSGNLFLKAINDNEKIRPYLKNYPFLPQNIEVIIFLKNPDRSEIGLNKLHVITLSEGKLYYYIRSLDTERLTRIHSETFEEAASMHLERNHL